MLPFFVLAFFTIPTFINKNKFLLLTSILRRGFLRLIIFLKWRRLVQHVQIQFSWPKALLFLRTTTWCWLVNFLLILIINLLVFLLNLFINLCNRALGFLFQFLNIQGQLCIDHWVFIWERVFHKYFLHYFISFGLSEISIFFEPLLITHILGFHKSTSHIIGLAGSFESFSGIIMVLIG